MIIAQTVQTPAGPLAMLAKDDVLVAAGFTGDPEAMFVARLSPELRKLGLAVGEVPGAAGSREGISGRTPRRPRRHRGRPARNGAAAAADRAARGQGRHDGELRGTGRTGRNAAGRRPARRAAPAPRTWSRRSCRVTGCCRSTGGYGGYYYGTPVKEWLLAHEGASL